MLGGWGGNVHNDKVIHCINVPVIIIFHNESEPTHHSAGIPIFLLNFYISPADLHDLFTDLLVQLLQIHVNVTFP